MGLLIYSKFSLLIKNQLMKAYVNVLIFWINTTLTLTRKEYWSHVWKIYPLVIKSVGDDFSVYLPDRNRPKSQSIAG
jgi:hypothetical protein